VFYSVGNFAFPSSSADAQESLVLRLTFDDKGLETVEAVPAAISWKGVPRIASGRAADTILGHLDGYCSMFNSRISGGAVLHSEPRQTLVYDATADAPPGQIGK